MDTDRLGRYIADSMDQLHIEAKIVKRIVSALNAAHDPITSVFDGEKHTPVEAGSLAEINRLVFNLDEAYLETASGGWVRIVLGNGFDCLVDYTLNLEEALQPVNDWIDKHN